MAVWTGHLPSCAGCTGSTNDVYAIHRLQLGGGRTSQLVKNRLFQSKVLAMKAAPQLAMHSEQLNRRNLGAQLWSIVLLVLNLIGAVVYVVRASNGWVIPRERELGLHSVTGEPYIWALSVLPVCAVFLVLSLTW